MILMKTRANSLSDVRQLNVWGFDLRDVSVFRHMPNIEVVSLSVNEIRRLDAFTDCRKLRELHLRKNSIEDFEELKHLAPLANLQHLALLENPISKDPEYRQKVVRRLPQLSILDSEPVTDADRIWAASMQPIAIYMDPRKSENVNPMDGFAAVRSWRPTGRRIEKPSGTSQDAVLSAVLALLPSLSEDSMTIVLQTISRLVD
jgi:hypothetical protein